MYLSEVCGAAPLPCHVLMSSPIPVSSLLSTLCVRRSLIYVYVMCFNMRTTANFTIRGNAASRRASLIRPWPLRDFSSADFKMLFFSPGTFLLWSITCTLVEGLLYQCGGISVQSQAAALDKANVKQTVDWQCDMFGEHRPTANYTSRDNCSLYSPRLCSCFLPVESHSGRRTT